MIVEDANQWAGGRFVRVKVDLVFVRVKIELVLVLRISISIKNEY